MDLDEGSAIGVYPCDVSIRGYLHEARVETFVQAGWELTVCHICHPVDSLH